jgi:hypothetical protein
VTLAATSIACDVDPAELSTDRAEDPPAAEAVASQTHALTSDTLEQFAAKCDAAIGVTVPDFNCDAETASEPPGNDIDADGKCQQPNQLHQECDPGSKFQVLTRTDDAYVVAHCRKQHHAAGRFGDIAVIQYNRHTGATCFYQALGNLSGDVKAPSRGTSAYPWKTPKQTADIKCIACHDNGPIIRSAYLSGVATVDGGRNKLPGDGDVAFNKDQPYSFVGNDFADWKAYKVEVAGNFCNGCHRMGASTFGGGGTSRDFGIRATAADLPPKQAHSDASPIWTYFMHATPYTHAVEANGAVNQAAADNFATLRTYAEAIRDCANHVNDATLPNTAACKITPFTGAPAPSVPGSFSAVWTRDDAPEIQVYGWTYAAYRAKYDQLWNQGWRLDQLQPYVVNGAVRYNAVWRQSNEGEIQVYGKTYDAFRAKYDELWPQGWRLKILQPYVVNGALRYTAVWTPSTAAEIQVYGWSYADYRAKYDELWPQGWRLKLIQPYVLNGEVLYTAVWKHSTAGEIQVYGRTYASFRAKYDALWPQGWRLKMLRPYVIDNGEVRYTAVWQPGSYDETQVYGWSYADFRARYDQLWDQGWRLSSLTAY